MPKPNFDGMSGNTFGTWLKLSTFGESHGLAIGGILDGLPPGIAIDTGYIEKQMRRRRPGQSALTTPRSEQDQIKWLSGIFEGQSTGTPIGFLIENKDAQSSDYEQLKQVYRPGHADYTYAMKYGIRDYRGGGRSSARETAARVAAGALAELWLLKHQISIVAFVSRVGQVQMPLNQLLYSRDAVDCFDSRCPDEFTAKKMEALILQAKEEGDTLGGKITCIISGVPPGLGEPVFDKLHADLGKAMLSINAVKSFELGMGIEGLSMKGSEWNDVFETDDSGKVFTRTNRSGGIQGGISNGAPIVFHLGFKPVSTVRKPMPTVTISGETTVIETKGRHDPCVLPRAVPIVEAMAALCIGDHLLRYLAYKHKI